MIKKETKCSKINKISVNAKECFVCFCVIIRRNDHSLRNKEELRNKWCSQGQNLKAKVLKQYECPAANCSTPQDRRR